MNLATVTVHYDVATFEAASGSPDSFAFVSSLSTTSTTSSGFACSRSGKGTHSQDLTSCLQTQPWQKTTDE